MTDIDLLLRDADRFQAKVTLEALGYHALYPANRPVSARAHYNIPMKHSETGAVIELHRAFAQPERYTIDYDAMFERAVTREVSGRSIRTLSVEDHILHLVIHSAKHGFCTLDKYREDLKRLFACVDFEPDVLAHRLKISSARSAWYFGMLELQGQARLDSVHRVDVPRPHGWRRRLYRTLPDPLRHAVALKGWEYLLRQLLAVDSSLRFVWAGASFARRRVADHWA